MHQLQSQQKGAWKKTCLQYLDCTPFLAQFEATAAKGSCKSVTTLKVKAAAAFSSSLQLWKQHQQLRLGHEGCPEVAAFCSSVFFPGKSYYNLLLFCCCSPFFFSSFGNNNTKAKLQLMKWRARVELRRALTLHLLIRGCEPSFLGQIKWGSITHCCSCSSTFRKHFDAPIPGLVKQLSTSQRQKSLSKTWEFPYKCVDT